MTSPKPHGVTTSILGVETSVCLSVEDAAPLRAQWPTQGWSMRPISLDVTYRRDGDDPAWRTSSWRVNGIRILASGALSRNGQVAITCRELPDPPDWVIQAIDEHRPEGDQ